MSHSCPNLVSTSFLYNPYIPFFNLQKFFIYYKYRDERDAPLTQYITNAGITRIRYTITHFKHHHHVLWLISNQRSVYHRYIAQVYVRNT